MAFGGRLVVPCIDVLSGAMVALTSSPAESARVAELFEVFKKPPPFAALEMDSGLKVFAEEGAIQVDDPKLVVDSELGPLKM